MKSAIMFADIVGSTTLYEKLGDVVAAECVGQCLNRMAEITLKNNGIVIKSIGDEILCRFVDANDAAYAAIKIQDVFTDQNQTVNIHKEVISLRIGIHYGEILNHGADVFGDVVNVASRIAKIANAKQILTTEETIAQLHSDLACKTRYFDQIYLKGKQNVSILFEILREGRSGITSTYSTDTVRPQDSQYLQFVYNGIKKSIQQDSGSLFVLGRSSDCDLVIGLEIISRIHAYCAYDRNKSMFMLNDKSTNGTYIKTTGNKEVYLRKGELPLTGKGLIGLGKTTAIDHGQIIQFSCSRHK